MVTQMSGKTYLVQLVKVVGGFDYDYESWRGDTLDFIPREEVDEDTYLELCQWVSSWKKSIKAKDFEYVLIVKPDDTDIELLKTTHKEFLDRERKKREAEDKKKAEDKAKRESKALEAKRKKLEKLKAELEGAN